MSDNDNDITQESETVESAQVETTITTPADDWKDQYLRLAAEFDNFRKRTAREYSDLVRNAERSLISDLTEAYDDLVRALSADHMGESVEQFAQGVDQIKAKFWRSLEKRGLERLVTVGEKFDPEAHDALARMPSDDQEEGIVVQEIAPGYKLGGKILRHAKVVVSAGKAE